MCGTRESWATDIKLKGISLKTLDIVVSFIYNEKVRILGKCGESWLYSLKSSINTLETDTLYHIFKQVFNPGDNVQGILSAAEMMDLPALKRMALKFMTSHIQYSNCLAVWQVSELYSCNIAAQEARGYALKNFTKVTATPEFLDLSSERLEVLLSDDLLKVPEERVVLEALTRWFHHDEEGRKGHMPRLLNSVR